MGSSYENVHQQKFPAIRYIDSALDYGIIILFIQCMVTVCSPLGISYNISLSGIH